MIKAIRGAITVNKNDENAISEATFELLSEIIKQNEVNLSDVISCTFTMTKDLNAAYPAKFARERLGFSNIPMMCYQELDIEGSLKMCLRVLLTLNCTKNAKHVYLKGAKTLRPDLGKD